MNRANLTLQSCSIARTVSQLGDPWTIMILRELFLGTRRFDKFLRLTGISPHLLSQRLKKLEDLGAIQRSAYCQRPLRHEYHLTEMGRDLWPIIIAFKQWGDRWLGNKEPSVQIAHKGCGAVVNPHVTCPDCGDPMEAYDASAILTEDFQRERHTLLGKVT